MSKPGPASTLPETVLPVDVKKKSSVLDPPFKLANFEYVKVELSTPAFAPVSSQLLAVFGTDKGVRAGAAFERHGYRASRQLNWR